LAGQLATGIACLAHGFGILKIVYGDVSEFDILERHVDERIETVLLKIDADGDILADQVGASLSVRRCYRFDRPCPND
jgi:hypothetical protein